MELSAEKTLITHSNTYARFLGYDVRVRRNGTVKHGATNRVKKRTLNNMTELAIPLEDKIMRFLFDKTTLYAYTKTSFESRLAAKVCELCGTPAAQSYEIHHVHKVKDLKGKELWEQVMIAKRRKTIVL